MNLIVEEKKVAKEKADEFANTHQELVTEWASILNCYYLEAFGHSELEEDAAYNLNAILYILYLLDGGEWEEQIVLTAEYTEQLLKKYTAAEGYTIETIKAKIAGSDFIWYDEANDSFVFGAMIGGTVGTPEYQYEPLENGEIRVIVNWFYDANICHAQEFVFTEEEFPRLISYQVLDIENNHSIQEEASAETAVVEEEASTKVSVVEEKKVEYSTGKLGTAWLGNVECRILEYSGEEDALIKFRCGDYIVQCLVPVKMVEEPCYSYYIYDYDYNAKELINVGRVITTQDGDFTINFAVGMGKGYEESGLKDLSMETLKQNYTKYTSLKEEYQAYYEYESEHNGETIIARTAGTAVDEREQLFYLFGYSAYYNYPELQKMIIAGAGIEEEAEWENMKKYAESFSFRELEDSDYFYNTLYSEEEFMIHMEEAYKLYVSVLENPHEVLEQKYQQAFYAEEIYRYGLHDFTNDGVLEIIFGDDDSTMYIIGVNGIQKLGQVSELYQSEEPSTFYAKSVRYGWVELRQYEIELNEMGEMEITLLSTLSYNELEDGNKVNYYFNGEEITQEQYEQKRSYIESGHFKRIYANRENDGPIEWEAFCNITRSLKDGKIFAE